MCGAVTPLLCPRPDRFALRARRRRARGVSRDRSVRKQLPAFGRGLLLARGWKPVPAVVPVERYQLVFRALGQLVVVHDEIADATPISAEAVLGDPRVKVAPNQV